ncbi:MAG: flagellar motor switch protein FliM [Phycisphaerae bacterium]|nr:flagellar motor switch protein FliM [Phycisphaerae bacterium]
MAETLEKNEVDALLTAINEGEVADQSAPATAARIFGGGRLGGEAGEVHTYDFKNPQRISRDQLRALRQLHDRFARLLGAELSGFLRTLVEVKLANVEQTTYGQFIDGLPNPTSVNVLECRPLTGLMCLEISPLILYPVIDRLLGGRDSEMFIPQRPLTDIELRLAAKVTDRVISALTGAWEEITPACFACIETETSPAVVQIVPANELCVVLGFELNMGSRAGTMSFCAPFEVIEPLMVRLAAHAWDAESRPGSAGRARSGLTDQLQQAPVLATGILAETAMTLGELMQMKPGDMIMTDIPATAETALAIEGEKKFSGRLGQHRGNRAFQVTGRLRPQQPPA